MKCQECKEDISPKFVAAIRDNICPACGSRIMSDEDYKRIYQVQNQLGNLNLDKNLLFGVAAAISLKFTLVPRDFTKLDEDIEGVKEEDLVRKSVRTSVNSGIKRSPKEVKKIKELREEAEDLADMTEEDIRQIEEEWGMNSDPSNTPLLIESADMSKFIDKDLVSQLDNIPFGEGGGGKPLVGESGSADLKRETLLARAAQVSTPKIRRMTP